MRDKIQFVKWLFRDIKGFDYWFAGMLAQQLITAVLMFTLAHPYDIWAIWYQLFLVTVGAIYFFVVHPLYLAYKEYRRTK